jgi:hypothetical protein
MVPSHFRAKAGAIAALLVAAFSIASCSKSADTEGGAPGAGPEQAAQGPLDLKRFKKGTSAALEAAANQTCGGTGAHDKHAGFPAGCATCHPCGGLLGIAEITFPRGTSTAGATVTTGNPASCTVACHFPFGGTPKSIAWNVQGPLNCTSCHFQVGGGTSTYLSAHAVPDANPVLERSGCEACHALQAHLSGTVRIFTGEGTAIDVLPNAPPGTIDTACKNCHDGTGNALGNRTPPVLVGYADTVDFHGARSGTGWGGTLIAPYQRGAAALPCKACHDTHASANPYMFGGTVNGTPVAAGVINRAGVGAEALCERCHAGPRHQGCGVGFDCHGTDPQPSGSACFFCHGHEGIVNWIKPPAQHTQSKPEAGCVHCHSPGWGPVIEYTPPAIVNGLVQVTNLTGNSATITWTTNEKATSYVEYGLGTPGRVAGNNTLATSHSVTLTGLSEDTAYVFRVRTADAMRNVTLTALGELRTASVSAPPAPTLIDQTHVVQCDPLASVTLRWNAAVDPQGDPVQYRVVLDDSPAFDSPRADSGWISATSFTTIVDLGDPSISYYWRVQARDSAHLAYSPWSGVDHFYGYWDQYCE